MGSLRDPGRPLLVVGEDEHAHRPRLSVTERTEHRRSDPLGSVTQDGRNRGHLDGRARAEEGDRDVQVRFGDDACPWRRTKVVLLPARDLAARGRGQRKAQKEPKALITPDATGGGHAEV